MYDVFERQNAEGIFTMSNYSELLVSGKNKYKSLIFDFAGVDNVDQYYENYRIPEGETMMVYAYSSQYSGFSLEGNGTIITDCAIYVDPAKKGHSSTNRIPLSDICHFVVFQEDNSDSVSLISQERECRIFGRTVAPRDTTGMELVELLRSLQRNLTNMNPTERHAYELTLGWLMDLIRKSLHTNGRLTARDEKLLDIVEEMPAFFKEIAFLRAENTYRACDDIAYFAYVESLKGRMDEDARKVLKNPGELFFSSYIEDISDASRFYMTKDLITPYLNLKKTERLTLEQCLILCFLCIRLEDIDYGNRLMDMIGPDLPAEEFWKLQCFKARFMKEKLSLVYEKMESGNELSKSELFWEDDLGLTPLHYALILRQEDVVLKLLHERDWISWESPFKDNRLVDAVYDFVFLASVLYDDEELIRAVYSYTTREAAPIHRAIKKMDSLIFIQRTLLREHPEDALTYATKEAEYQDMREEMVEELLTMSKHRCEEARKIAAMIIQAEHPYARHILHMYLDRDSIYRSIADTISDYRLYKYKHRFFVTAVEENLDLSFYEWRNGVMGDHDFKRADTRLSSEHVTGGARSFYDGDTYENPDISAARERKRAEEEKRRKEKEQADSKPVMPTSEGWFSPEAHHDIELLKKEYRQLVKMYHPDVSDNRRATIIIQQIMTERAEILERM